MLCAVVFLHGVGSDGENVKPVAEWLVRQMPVPEAAVQVLCPTAAVQPVTYFNNEETAAWFNLVHSIQFDDDPSIRETAEDSRLAISALILKTLMDNPKITPNHVVLAGFSQGAALAYHIAFNLPVKIGAVLAFGGWIPFNKLAIKTQQRVLHCHGMEDQVVRHTEATAATLEARCPGEYKIKLFHCRHEIVPAALAAATEFLQEAGVFTD